MCHMILPGDVIVQNHSGYSRATSPQKQLSSEFGTNKRVTARFWTLEILLSCCLFARLRDRRGQGDLIRTIVYDKYSGSMKITTHLDHTSHFKIVSGTKWSSRWTYPTFTINTHRD